MKVSLAMEMENGRWEMGNGKWETVERQQANLLKYPSE